MKEFCKAAGYRALRTFAQVLISCIGVSTTLNEVNWKIAFSTAILATIISVLTSIVLGIPEVDGGLLNDKTTNS